jgi:hypothetical protein
MKITFVINKARNGQFYFESAHLSGSRCCGLRFEREVADTTRGSL